MKNYFITKGSGESNLNSLNNETTSYDAALVNSGIGNVNITLLSSMIPPDCTEVPYYQQNWGDILFSIMARKDGKRGKTISCALMIVKVYNQQILMGSFVLEYSGNAPEYIAQKRLLEQLNEMVKRRNYGEFYEPLKMYYQNRTHNGYIIIPTKIIYNSLKVKKRNGTVISSICYIK